MRSPATLATFLCCLALAACGYSDGVLSSLWQAEPAKAAPPAPPPAPPPAQAAAAPAKPATKLPPAPAAETRTPFVVIRFGGPEPDYARPLYEAMEGALKRKPDAAFDLVAVTGDADAAERDLQKVFVTMTKMGLPAERVTLSAAAPVDEATDEVWVYVR